MCPCFSGVLYYDYLLTFADEIRVVWRAPLSIAGALYVIIRYGAIVDMTLESVINVRPNTSIYGFGFTTQAYAYSYSHVRRPNHAHNVCRDL